MGDRSGRDAGEIISRFTDAFYDEYANNNYDNPKQRTDDIHELVLHAGRCSTIESFLNDIALLTNTDTANQNVEDEDNAIRLSTIHQAKGLEWPVVIILWASEGMFPAPKSVEESFEGEAEERRLFYVAVTRAKKELVICSPEMRYMRDGGVIYCGPSRFVKEIPSEQLQRVFR